MIYNQPIENIPDRIAQTAEHIGVGLEKKDKDILTPYIQTLESYIKALREYMDNDFELQDHQE